ncbi:helix-turn-helix transcriptional regulator [Pseudomonas gregormendelii]|uniref:Helix-turn-helix transcriptional regulator n=1 Tax=Pseudomonas gregormendelii TaxID=1628277 RepID=A0ABS3AP37_9PSED|nr:helix-turn-helix transcriptional regulator [Pseudomonas gregormendelii]MBN3968628.1 helix-turn-helix transcriptional regulator [Pseudomonas gregormendelii]
MELNVAFGQALKGMRILRRLPQHKFFGGTSRAYMTLLEQGRRCPTLSKIEDLAAVLEVHPLSLIVECYLQGNPDQSLESLFEQITQDLSFDPDEYGPEPAPLAIAKPAANSTGTKP